VLIIDAIFTCFVCLLSSFFFKYNKIISLFSFSLLYLFLLYVVVFEFFSRIAFLFLFFFFFNSTRLNNRSLMSDSFLFYYKNSIQHVCLHDRNPYICTYIYVVLHNCSIAMIITLFAS
jgi:hypothetical protein